MNVSKSPLRRRATAIVAGSVLGLAGAVALAGPASAHHSKVTGSAECITETGQWKVNWKVQLFGSQDGNQYRFLKVESTPTPVEGISVGGDWKPNADALATQTVPGDAQSATLIVRAEWNNGVKEGADQIGTVRLEGECKAPKPPTSPSPSPSKPSSPSATPSTPVPTTPPPTVPSDLPGGEPEPIVELTCDTITLGADNPDDGIELKMKFETSKGEVRETVVKPGQKKTETFSATTGFKVKWTISVTIDGETESFTETIPYTQPDDCDGEGDPDLPLTGAAAGGIAGGAGALLLVGAGLYLLARRRKVTFTA